MSASKGTASGVRNGIIALFLVAGFLFVFTQFGESYILSQAGQSSGSLQGPGLTAFFQQFIMFKQVLTLGALGLALLAIILIPVYASQRKKEKAGRNKAPQGVE